MNQITSLDLDAVKSVKQNGIVYEKWTKGTDPNGKILLLAVPCKLVEKAWQNKKTGKSGIKRRYAEIGSSFGGQPIDDNTALVLSFYPRAKGQELVSSEFAV